MCPVPNQAAAKAHSDMLSKIYERNERLRQEAVEREERKIRAYEAIAEALKENRRNN